MRVGEQMQQAGSLRNGLTTPLKSVTVPAADLDADAVTCGNSVACCEAARAMPLHLSILLHVLDLFSIVVENEIR